MSTVSIAHEQHGASHEFVLTVDGERAGFLEYTPGDGVLRIEYVEVVPELRGSGLGRQLVEKAVAYARQMQLHVVPICGYARTVIERDPVLSAAVQR